MGADRTFEVVTVPAGSLIDGRYQVLGNLGAPGAQGEAYRVLDTFTNEVVALKLLLGTQLGPWHEAQQLTKLRDDHILAIRNADHAAGTPYVVTELATNGTVYDRLVQSPAGKLDIPTTMRWVQQATTAVVRTHDAGLLHTDVKPENLFLDANSNVLLGDFGMASVIDANGRGHNSGTPATMAPEVAAVWGPMTRGTSGVSDVYSLGATAYHLLTGAKAFEDDPAVPWVTQLPTYRPKRLREVAPHVPRAVYECIERAMSFDPSLRPQSASAFAVALGKAKLPKRLWRQTNEHTGHAGCWRGEEPRKATILVCAEAVGKKFRVGAVKLPSGHKVHGSMHNLAATPAQLNGAVRKVIESLA